MPVSAYLKRAYPSIPQYALREALSKKDVRVNGQRALSGAHVTAGDEVKLYIADKYTGNGLAVLHEGGGLLVCEKPQGLPVDLDGDGIGEDTLLTRARASYPEAELLHRLDAGTGGVILLAIREDTCEAMLRAFREGTLIKEYTACLLGVPEKKAGTWEGYISKDSSESLVRVYDSPREGAKRAVSVYRIVSETECRGEQLSLACIRIHTGRTHQIRAQAAHAGMPVIGDDKYGNREANRLLNARLPSLWCSAMELAGPAVPEDLRGLRFESRPRFPLMRLFEEG